MADTEPADFACEAYGPDGATFGALCFRSGETGKRVCADLPECHAVMTTERQRVYRRISELAAGGDETMAFLAEEFTRPEHLLGGGGPADEESGDA
jgi:hypothetical protein